MELIDSIIVPPGIFVLDNSIEMTITGKNEQFEIEDFNCTPMISV